jgi:CPA1 family monovalent cation:H+ antiporter
MDPRQTVEWILVLLAGMAALATLARQLGVPYPVLFVLGGAALSFIPGGPRVTIPPDLILLLFLPPLIYDAGVFVPLRDVRASGWPISVLAIGLVLATMGAVALVAHLAIPGLSWATAFVLGAIIAQTDIVVVLAVAERIPIPERVMTVIEGEALFNDATSLVLYRVAVAAVVTGTFSLAQVSVEFAVAAIGGVVIGLAVGWLTAAVRRYVSDPLAEITVSLLTPYVAWIPAEAIGASGVLAVVTAAAYVSRARFSRLPPGTRLQDTAFWEVLTFLLQGFLFILVGLQLAPVLGSLAAYPPLALVAYAALVSVTAIVLRIVWVFGAARLHAAITRFWSPDAERPDWRELALVAWMGMRGSDSLVTALALPLVTSTGMPFPHRDLILFLTFAVILCTLVLQGLGLTPLIRAFGVSAGAVDREERLAWQRMTHVALARLQELSHEAWVPAQTAARLRLRLEHRANDFTGPKDRSHLAEHAAARRLRREVLAAQRREAIRLRDRGIINDAVLHRVERDLDLEEVALEAED